MPHWLGIKVLPEYCGLLRDKFLDFKLLGFYRLMLAMGVVASHTNGYAFDRFPDAGIIAVIVFFFVSGYLMPASFCVNYAYVKFGDRSKNYLINRFLRIYPIYWFSLGFVLLVIVTVGREVEYDFGIVSLLQNFLLLGLNQDQFWRGDIKYIGPAWTLDIELQYYLLVPALVFLCQRLRYVFLILIACWFLIGGWFLLKPIGIPSVDRSILVWGPVFMLGFFSYEYRSIFSKLPPGSFLLTFLLLQSLGGWFSLESPRQAEWVIAFGFMVLALRLLLFGSKEFSRWDRLAGDLAYPLFILHLPVILLIGNHFAAANFWISMLINAVASLSIAWLAHILFDPLLNRMRAKRKAH